MIATKSFVGGARIGTMDATIPFARLLISNGKLSLHCFGKFDLVSKEVTCESVRRISLLSSGIQFHHIRADYPWPMIFWCIRRKTVMDCLQKAGFETQ